VTTRQQGNESHGRTKGGLRCSRCDGTRFNRSVESGWIVCSSCGTAEVPIPPQTGHMDRYMLGGLGRGSIAPSLPTETPPFSAMLESARGWVESAWGGGYQELPEVLRRLSREWPVPVDLASLHRWRELVNTRTCATVRWTGEHGGTVEMEWPYTSSIYATWELEHDPLPPISSEELPRAVEGVAGWLGFALRVATSEGVVTLFGIVDACEGYGDRPTTWQFMLPYIQLPPLHGVPPALTKTHMWRTARDMEKWYHRHVLGRFVGNGGREPGGVRWPNTPAFAHEVRSVALQLWREGGRRRRPTQLAMSVRMEVPISTFKDWLGKYRREGLGTWATLTKPDGE